MIILAFDPGRDKCGIALGNDTQILYHQVIDSQKAIATIQELREKYHPDIIVMGNQTTSREWQEKLTQELGDNLEIKLVNEKNSTQEAKNKYWEIYPPQGLQRLIPLGLRIPPRPVDDIVAIILIERYLYSLKNN